MCWVCLGFDSWIKDNISFFVIGSQKICLLLFKKEPSWRAGETNVYCSLCQVACCIVRWYKTQPKMAVLPNLAWLSVKQAGVTAYDWLFCVLTLWRWDEGWERPSVPVQSYIMITTDRLNDRQTKDWPEVNRSRIVACSAGADFTFDVL